MLRQVVAIVVVIVLSLFAMSAEAALTGGFTSSTQFVDSVQTGQYSIDSKMLEAQAAYSLAGNGGTYVCRLVIDWRNSSGQSVEHVELPPFEVRFGVGSAIDSFIELDYPDKFDTSYDCKFSLQVTIADQ